MIWSAKYQSLIPVQQRWIGVRTCSPARRPVAAEETIRTRSAWNQVIFLSFVCLEMRVTSPMLWVRRKMFPHWLHDYSLCILLSFKHWNANNIVFPGSVIGRWFAVNCCSLQLSVATQRCILLYVSGFEKRGNFAQNAKFWHFSSYLHFKAVGASDFILGFGAHQAFCFTNPTFEAIDVRLWE